MVYQFQGPEDSLHAFLDVWSTAFSNVHEPEGFEVGEVYAFLHVNMAHVFDRAAALFDFLAVVDLEFVHNISWINLKFCVPVWDYQDIPHVLCDLPISQC